MKKVIRNQKGFTLLEIIVVLAVLGALAAMMTPVVFRYIDDANRARTQSDVNTIAAAIQQQYKDVGRWPSYAVGTSKLSPTAGSDAVILTSNGCAGAPAAFGASGAGCDTTKPEFDSGGTFGAAASLAGSLTDQLIKNTPAYTKWRGPYLDTVPANDAWGRSYVVNIGKTDVTDATPKVVVVLSAGPDGIIQTLGNVVAKDGTFVAGGDDIVARVK